MAPPSEKLAQTLEVLRELQERGMVAIRARDLTRTHRERLIKNGFLKVVMKGWYIPSAPDEAEGDSTSWYASYWTFCAAYLNERFDNDWCLSPEQSLSLHAGNWTVPVQLLVRSPKARNKVTNFPHDTSLFDVRSAMPERKEIVEKEGLRLFSLPAALVACSPNFFRQNATDARAALSMVRDSSDVLTPLLKGSHSVIAGRLAGAFRNIGRDRIADEIIKTMRKADYDVRENDPFDIKVKLAALSHQVSPYVNRIHLIWQDMREQIIEYFPPPPPKPNDIEAYLKRVEETYVTDAYHSLSIEGYRVSAKLIARVRSANWNPEANEEDREYRNALAANGYYRAFQEVKKSLRQVLSGANPGTVADDHHVTWYRELFAPCVTAGLLQPADLAGYRNGPVYIRGSKHVPPNREAVRDLMPAFFELMREESEPCVRIVLGHFIFVYIHPYMDGNGRMGRFLMNVMLGSGGYPWTVIPVERRDAYMDALEEASVGLDIIPFTKFLGELVAAGMKGKPVATAPAI